jgi:hypothetical protein
MLFSLNLAREYPGIYGSNLSANNETLRSALDSLRAALTSSLGDKCQCAGTFVQMETTIDRIEQKLNDLVLEPSPVVAGADESLLIESQAQLNFAVDAPHLVS